MSIEIVTIGAIYTSMKAILGLIKTIKKIKKKRRTKKELVNKELDFILINLSGKSLSKNAVDEINTWGKCKILNKSIPNIDLSNPVAYMDNILLFCSNTIEDLIKKDKIIENLLLGKYILIPPGMPSIATTFVTMFHGISGHFPNMAFFYKDGMTYNVIKPFDFQTLRIQSRDIEKSEGDGEKFLILNLSGKVLSPEAKHEVNSWGDLNIIDLQIPTVDLNNSLTYMNNATSTCETLINNLIEDDQLRYNLLIGNYAIIPPGMNSLAITFIAMLHGITGHFPMMSFFYKKDVVFSITKPFDFHDLRVKFRDIS